MAEDSNGLSKLYIYGVFVVMIISGSLSGLTVKFQSSIIVDGQKFEHPYMNSLTMFIGESFLFIPFLIQNYRNPQKEKGDEQKSLKLGKKLKINWFFVLIPTALDFIDATIQFVCIIFIPVSVVKIIGSGKVVITAIYSRILFKTELTNNQYLGIGFTLIGMICVASSNFLFQDSEVSNSFWLIVYILNQFVGGAVNIASEWVFSKYHIHQLKMIGGQGLWGILIMAIFLPIINFVPCSFDEGCIYNNDGDPYIERTDIWAQQIRDSGLILFTIFLQFFIYVTFNYCQITITKFVGAISYAVNILAQTFVVWIVGIIVTKYSDDPNFKWENLDAGTIILQSIGCLFIILGNLVFNGVIYLFKNSKRKLMVDEFQKSYNENTCKDEVEYTQALLEQQEKQ